MGKLNQRLSSLESALSTLEDILQYQPSVVVRDATIQRFEYTTEAAWKTLKHSLLEHEGVDCNTPKGCIRKALQAELLTEKETESFLQMINDRNLSSYAYLPEVADKIASAIPYYAKLIRKLADSMNKV